MTMTIVDIPTAQEHCTRCGEPADELYSPANHWTDPATDDQEWCQTCIDEVFILPPSAVAGPGDPTMEEPF